MTTISDPVWDEHAAKLSAEGCCEWSGMKIVTCIGLDFCDCEREK